MTVFISGEREEGKADSACHSYLLHNSDFCDLYHIRKARSEQFHPFQTVWAKFATSMKCCISTEIDGATPVQLRTWLCMSVHSAMIALDVQHRTSICF